jgi:coenzyme F420 hydrogenase subunit beta
MGCQTSSPPVMWDRKAGKVSKPLLFNIGLLCSKTFDDAIFAELFEAKYGLAKSAMTKMNIKGCGGTDAAYSAEFWRVQSVAGADGM